MSSSRLNKFIKSHWGLLTLVLCVIGFFKEIRPIDNYDTNYYIGPPLKIPVSDLDAIVYPAFTYGYLVGLIPVFLLTDLLRYKAVIILEGIFSLTYFLVLRFARGIAAQAVALVFYGFGFASEVAYYSYIYAAIHTEKYEKATSYVRAASVLGRSACAIISQSMVDAQPEPFSYCVLIYITIACMIFGLCVTMVLPDVSWKTAIVKLEPTSVVEYHKVEPDRHASYTAYVAAYFQNLPQNFLRCYSCGHVVKWSIWWALATCVYLQVWNYAVNLWVTVDPKANANGTTELIDNIVATLLVLGIQFVKVRWDIYGEMFIGVLMCMDALILYWSARTDSILVVYFVYIVYCSSYQLLITVATHNLAMKLETHSYAFVMGFNTFLALVFESILTVVVNDKHGLGLGVRSQYVVYAGIHFAIAVLFCTIGGCTLGRNRRKSATTIFSKVSTTKYSSIAA